MGIIFLFLLSLFGQAFLQSILNFRNDCLDCDLPTPAIIRRAGYPVESHTIMTDDFYILTIHRIPGPKGSHPVLLQHGLLSSSADWVVTGHSIGYMLADLGYDVWLGNVRGNTYGRAHKTISPSDSKFWDFSWHEIGIYDLSAIIEFIVNFTKSSLTYIAHSMGTTSFFAMASDRPDIIEKKMVREMYCLAPIAFIRHMKSPLRLFGPFAHELEFLAKVFGANEFLPQNPIIKFLAKYGCDLDTKEEYVCENIMFVLGGFDPVQINSSTLPVILNHTPAGTSTKTIIHYAQEINTDNFLKYDYGKNENMLKYNSTEAPAYDLSKLTLPVTLFYGINDWFTHIKDVNKLFEKLPEQKTMQQVNFSKWNHFDFLYGIDAPDLVYKPIIESMKRFENERSVENHFNVKIN